MIRLLVVDDHAIVRAGVKHLLSARTNITIGEASCSADALAMIDASNWDVALIDISLPDMPGTELLRKLKALPAMPKVIMFSMHSEDRFALHVKRGGAMGYLEKQSVGTELLKALDTVRNGKTFFRQDFSLSKFAEADSEYLHECLTTREYQVFYGLAQGLNVTTIAGQLLLSVKTISGHRARALEKMNMQTNADIIFYALTHNLID